MSNQILGVGQLPLPGLQQPGGLLSNIPATGALPNAPAQGFGDGLAAGLEAQSLMGGSLASFSGLNPSMMSGDGSLLAMMALYMEMIRQAQAGGGAAGGTGGATGGGATGGTGGATGGGPAPSGQVGQWINQAMEALKQSGVDMSKVNAQDIATIIQHESGGDPNAINRTDSNAAAGHPSQGLMQTIPSTFNQYALQGHNNITNPVDNIIAGVRYAIERYGSTSNVPGVKAVRNGGQYVGY